MWLTYDNNTCFQTIYSNWDACFFTVYLFVCGSLLLFWDLLIDIEDTRDVELHAVEVISNQSPQLVQTRVTRLCNLRGNRTSHETRSDDFLWVLLFINRLEDVNEGDFALPALFAMACPGCCVLFCGGSFPSR